MILSASLDGSLTICQIESNYLHEKWKCKIEPGDRYLPTCAILLLHHILIFGDRRGNITIIDASAMSKKVIKGAHEKQGVTDIRVVDTSSSPNGSTIRLQSIGRDGRLCTWQWFPTSTSLELMRSQVVGAPEKMEWPCKFLERHGRLLISGFRGPNFVLFDIDANHYLCSIECGGGHRFWQTEFPDDRTIRFKFIKQGTLVQADALLWSLTVTAPHLHVSQISSIAALNSESEFSLIVTGGIDTQLTVSVVNKGSRRVQVLQRITDHLSSVHCVTAKDGLVVSGGGRGEVKVWRLDDDRRLLPLLTCKEENQEARLLSVELFDLLGSVGLVAASSDGLLRCYQLNPDDRSASITAVVSLARQSPLGCVTKVAVLNDESGVDVIAIDTAGQVSAWSLTSWHCESPVVARSSTLVERSGLSALCAVALQDRRIAVVGSESGQLCALDCLRSSKIAAHMRHGATVTAIVAVERMAMASNHTHILTTALDRRLSLTRLSITDESLE
uniref:Uncharacterized protein n=1 Tax=Plectus sambesii TaxID=2011161 RepID=A0A914XIA0_9BILA